MMGGAADLPHRSSSPLKRPASDLEQETPAKDKEDVDMDRPQPSTEATSGADQSAHTTDATQSSQSSQPETVQQSSQGTDTTVGDVDEEFGADIPPIDEQIRRVKQLHDAFEAQPLTPGTRAYIISNTWLEHVQAHGSGAKVATQDAESPVGPVDNSDIIQEILTDQNGQPFARLKPDVGVGSISYFPVEAWDLVVQWHGITRGQPAIIRQAVDTSMDSSAPNVQFELHPVVFVIHRLWAATSPIPVSQILKASKPSAPIFIMSRNDKTQDFLRNIKRVAGIEVSKQVRVWSVPQSFDTVPSTESPITTASPSSRATTPAPDVKPENDWSKLLIEATAFNSLVRGPQRELLEVKDHTSDPKYNGSSTIDMAGLGRDQGLVLDELVEGHLFLAAYVEKMAKQGSKGVAINVTSANRTSATAKIDSGRSSPAPSGPVTRGRTQKSGKTVGTVGLTNLGNTCYMNSALQCIRSVEELTKYFLSDEANNELNTENPLGKGGHIALVYNSLLRELYKEPPPASIAPRQFKNTFGKYFSSFSGYGQQDSQEFLGILLDALQEDLNRVKKKPYIEKPDSTDEMVGNPDALRKMAEEVWDITKRRDDSVIGDLFTGMYKSTLVCPVCDKVSITFDPFSTVTVQLPIENIWSHEIFYLPLNDKPVRIAVDMDKQGSIKALKEFVSIRVGVPVDRLFIAEEWKSHFYKFFDDMKPVSEEIQSSDNILVIELESAPTNWPPVKKPKQKAKSMLSLSNFQDSDEEDVPSWHSPRAERMLVPVISRRPSATRFGKPFMFVPVPSFIILTPEEARNEDIIKRKVLERVANLTTYDFGGYESDDDANTSSIDPDIIVTTASDASSGDDKVVASSIDGEDDVVDITMKETNGADAESSTEINPRKRKFRSRRPKWIDPNQFLPAEFNSLFELSYFGGNNELVPTGWNVLNEDKKYPLLSTRAPIRGEAVEADDEQAHSFVSTNLQSDAESSEEDVEDIPQLAPTRMNEESSDDDDAGPNTRILPVRPIAKHSPLKVGSNRFRNGIRTYSRKGIKTTPQIARNSSEEPEEDVDQGPLIRLGEGIVLDWYNDPYETLFMGEEQDTMRGQQTYGEIPLRIDPVLDAKRTARQRRRKEGLSLAECLDEFGKDEILSEMDTWYCPRCKEHRRASKKLELWKTPDILIFHLKRFSSSATRRDKLDILVDFPINGLDMSTRVVESEGGKKEIYDLFAVDNHYGGLGGGHYTAYAKSFVDKDWYDYNDSSVSKLKDPTQVISGAAYLLFYRRRSESPLGGPRFKEIIERFDNPNAPSEDESTGSGEGQRLGADSSHRGSSSALTGVEATRLRGSGSGTGATAVTEPDTVGLSHVKPEQIDNPPDYKTALAEDTAPLLERDAVMNDGIEMRDGYDDEAIDLGSAYGEDLNQTRNLFNQTGSNWDFSGLHDLRTTNSADDELGSIGARSDDVQHDSSASEGSMAGRIADFDAAEIDEDYVEENPVPDVDAEALDFWGLHNDLVPRNTYPSPPVYREVTVLPPKTREEEDAEEATEIHVEEGEGVN